jgi:hypothetical protein
MMQRRAGSMRIDLSHAHQLLVACTLLACTPTKHERPREARAGDCDLCHADEWMATSAPPHATAEFGADCAACHDEQGWQPAPTFVHVGSFALALGHAEVACGSCHDGYAHGATSPVCTSCHAARAERVIDPDHAALPGDCSACHRTDAFWPARFVHSWPLEGVHALTSCRSCHSREAQPVYEATSSDCLSCHRADRARADAASARHRQDANTCNDCHGFESFRDLAPRPP